jgi:hypothetical protein
MTTALPVRETAQVCHSKKATLASAEGVGRLRFPRRPFSRPDLGSETALKTAWRRALWAERRPPVSDAEANKVPRERAKSVAL